MTSEQGDVLVVEQPIGPEIRKLTLRVRFTGWRVARGRCWVAAKLLKLASKIAGVGVSIEYDLS
jgi:hypothetical protein